MLLGRAKKRKRKMVGKLLSMEDYTPNPNNTASSFREKVRVCFIDDEGYPSLDKLISLGYKKTDVKFEFNDINDFSDYDVIFCDVQGVARNQSPDKHGLDAAIQLHQRYPSCTVFIYTGTTLEGFGKAPSDLRLISKQTPLPEIVSLLDKYCEKLWNPITAWKEIETNLRQGNVPNKEIALIEDDFFDNVINHNGLAFDEDELRSSLSAYSDVAEWINVVIGLVALFFEFSRR